MEKRRESMCEYELQLSVLLPWFDFGRKCRSEFLKTSLQLWIKNEVKKCHKKWTDLTIETE